MKNPNEYDNDAWVQASCELISAVQNCWEAGAEIENIEQDIVSGLENADLSDPFVTITVRS